MTADDHGIPWTYTNYGCRCPLCRRAIRLWRKRREVQALQRQRGVGSPSAKKV